MSAKKNSNGRPENRENSDDEEENECYNDEGGYRKLMDAINEERWMMHDQG